MNRFQQLLQKFGTETDVLENEDDYEQLVELLHFHEHRYYVLANPLISDAEYDLLFNRLKQTEAKHPNWIKPYSPSQRVGGGLTKKFETFEHLIPMLSLENSYNAEDLLDWDRKASEANGEGVIEYCVEPKYDGASISLLYEDDLFTRGTTRGDGIKGDDITNNTKRIRNIPLKAGFSTFGIQSIEIRGEILLTKKRFEAYNLKLIEEGLAPLANPRNAAAGSLRIKDAAEVGRRGLEGFFYHVGYTQLTPRSADFELPKTHYGMLQMLWDCGFSCPIAEARVFKGIEEVIRYCLDFETHRDSLPYEIDGMVIKVNSLALQEKLGMTSHHPRWAIAYKFKARQATSVLRSVQYQVGRTGSVTPVAKIDAAKIGGVTVTSVTLHNEDFINEKNLMLGDTVLVERAGDVIPQIARSLPEFRTGVEQAIVFPTSCPVCATPLYKPVGEAVWRCTNAECPAQVVERMIHFVSKDAMDIRSLGEQQIRKFFELGLLRDIPGIYQLDFAAIRQLEGFAARSIHNLEQSIQASKSQPLHRLIYALGIRHVGETMAKTIARNIDHINQLEQIPVEQLLQWEDVGPKVAESIRAFFENPGNQQILRQLELLGVNVTNQHAQPLKVGALQGKTFLFTGTLLKTKRSQAEALVEQAGGVIVSGVSSKLNYLVVGDDAGSKLEKAKKIPSIQMITEDEFLNLIAQH